MGGALPLYNLLYFQPAMINTLIVAAQQDAVNTAQHIVNDFSPGLQNRPFDASFTPRQEEIIQQLQTDYRLLKIKAFSPDGRVIFSTDGKDIGQRNREPYFMQQVARGQTLSKLAAKEDYSLEGQMLGQDLVETYVPIMAEGAFLGVLEFYFDITEKKLALNRLADSSTHFLLLMTLGFLTLFAIVSRWLKRADRQKLQAEAEVQQLAYNDNLTGLPNRRLFLDRLDQAVNRARREKVKVALLYLDLDRFKAVNDTLGHHLGDLLLKAVATRLSGLVRHSDTIARIGSDEFVHMLSAIHQDHQAALVAQKVIDLFKEPFLLEGHELCVTPSIGIALFPDNGNDSLTLLDQADLAMYTAKEEGRNGFAFFSADVNNRVIERHLLEKDLRLALPLHQFHLVYQPQLDLVSGKVVGAEALIRWQHPVRGLVLPEEFIPLAEETNLIDAIGDWVLRTACRQNLSWQNLGFRPIRMAVNLSPQQFRQTELLESIDLALKETGLDCRYLELELTETLVMAKAETAIASLNQLRARGIELSIDDFGTGYSSLSYLKHFPVNRLKIDRSFIGQLPADTHSAAIVEAILAMAKAMNLGVVAEGVENQAQLEFLQQHNCDLGQGFFFGHPVSAEEFVRHLQRVPAWPQENISGRAD
jgi:diguanylate cyclase (GGDEF)-like protein